MVIDGRAIAASIIARLTTLPKPERFLVAIVARTDAATASFVRQKERAARELGVDFRVYHCSGSVSTDEVAGTVRAYGADPACGGIIVQLPIPPQVSRLTVFAALPVEKDVDAIGGEATRAAAKGGAGVLPPAVGVIEKILKDLNLKVGTLHAVVVGAKGFLVGIPVSCWLEGKTASLTRIDVGDDRSPIKSADIVVSGTGQPGSLTPGDLKPGATVIDFGYGMRAGRVCGDFDASDADSINAKGITYTPTPGGTGPILVAQLFENFYALNREE